MIKKRDRCSECKLTKMETSTRASGSIMYVMDVVYRFIMMDHALMGTGPKDNDMVMEGKLI